MIVLWDMTSMIVVVRGGVAIMSPHHHNDYRLFEQYHSSENF